MFIAIIILLMFLGVLVGYVGKKRQFGFIHRIITILIWALLFLLGVEVGGNRNIIDNLHSIGMEAFIITLAALAGSVFASWILWIIIVKNKKGWRK